MARSHQRLIRRAYKKWVSGEACTWSDATSPFICDNLGRSQKDGESDSYNDCRAFIVSVIGDNFGVSNFLNLPIPNEDPYTHARLPEATEFRHKLWRSLAEHFGTTLPERKEK